MKKKIIVLVTLSLFVTSCQILKIKSSIINIPSSYRGNVYIFFSKNDGTTIKRNKEGKCVFNIPNDGILKVKGVKFQQLKDITPEYYLESIEADTRVKQMIAYDDKANKDSIFIMGESIWGVEDMANCKYRPINLYLFTVDSLKNFEKYIKIDNGKVIKKIICEQ